MAIQNVLIAGSWRKAHQAATFQPDNPATKEPLPDEYPLSTWQDCDAALTAAAEAFDELRQAGADRIARFLETYADKIEANSDDLVALAHAETALPVSPRLADVELPRTTAQLRKAATAARDGSWRMPTIDTAAGIRSIHSALGPVCIFGPNNFPFAFGSLSGGDFAAAIAAGNPVIGKANSSHPGTTRLFAELAHQAAVETNLPPAMVQLIYRTDHAVGERLVSDPRIGATGYTGSRSAGLKLKAAADAVGKPIYLELSSINPVVLLPGAISQRGEDLADEFVTSCLMGTGQFCTNPGLVLALSSEATERLIGSVAERFSKAPVGTLLSQGVAQSLAGSQKVLEKAGAKVLCGGTTGGGSGYSHANTLLRVDGARFLADAAVFQTEAFGNLSLWVVADDAEQLINAIDSLEGNLTGCVYSDTDGGDDELYNRIAPHLIDNVGRILNDKMPTGVAVSPAMNHGGPYPATGHAGFTAVGIPASLVRFTALKSFDNVRPSRLPPLLQDKNPSDQTWRQIDGTWTQANVES